MPIGIAVGVIVIIGLWVGYFVVAGWDDAQRGRGVMSKPYPWLALALVATFAAPPILFFAMRNYIWLIRHGTEIQGHVKSVSMVTHSGARPVTFAYSVNGKEYSVKRDTPNDTAKGYSPGTPVLLLVNPAKPKQVTVFDVD